MRFVVIGGDAAGMSAASQARRRTTPEQLEIVAFERGHFTSYSACGLPYFVADDVKAAHELIARTPEQHRANGIELHLRHEVTAIDPAARTVTVHDLDHDTTREESFDHLLIATGASPVRPDLPNVDADGVHGIQTLADGISLRDHVDRHPDGARAVVVGGGYIGLEMGEAMKRRGFDVTVVEAGEQPLSSLDYDMGALVADAIRDMGIHLQTSTKVTGFETTDGYVSAVVTESGTLPADLVVLGIGVKPNVALAEATGIALGRTGAIATDDRMATNVDGIWAGGDCAESLHRITGKRVAIALGTHANKHGRVIGLNVTGGNARFPGVVGTAATKVCAYEVARTGLTERKAADEGFVTDAVTIKATTRSGYMPDAQPITVKMVVERSSRRILGAQIIGRDGAAKRIDIVATALWNEMTAEDLLFCDLAYAPPFSPLWDPVQVAARKLVASP
jgi:NADPH-dependent 2,4-dienoyl-CoA reductase/sulfur reductase-like enzyme